MDLPDTTGTPRPGPTEHVAAPGSAGANDRPSSGAGQVVLAALPTVDGHE